MYDRLNYSEQAGLKMFSVLAIVCLLISLFGIYAVASAATQRRRKEVAVRKVVGARVGDIIRMFFREYTVQVMLAGAGRAPVGLHRHEPLAARVCLPYGHPLVVVGPA